MKYSRGFGRKMVESNNKKIIEYDMLRVVVTILVIISHCMYYRIETAYGGIDYSGLLARKTIVFNILEQIKEMILARDELQEKSGYYKIYPQTQIIDVTECKSAKESAQKVLEKMKEAVVNGI